MNALLQDTSFLIGSPQDIDALAGKTCAEIVVVSDSHGAEAQLLGILAACGRQADALVFCGDGMSELCSIMNQAAAQPEINALLPPVIAAVQGNNDISCYPLQTDGGCTRLKIPLTQTMRVCGHTLFITHGHHFTLYGSMQELSMMALKSGADTVLYGHTHVAAAEYTNSVLLLNPGSCVLPRGGQPPCYTRLRLKNGRVPPEFTFFRIQGQQHVPYVPPPRPSFC